MAESETGHRIVLPNTRAYNAAGTGDHSLFSREPNRKSELYKHSCETTTQTSVSITTSLTRFLSAASLASILAS